MPDPNSHAHADNSPGIFDVNGGGAPHAYQSTPMHGGPHHAAHSGNAGHPHSRGYDYQLVSHWRDNFKWAGTIVVCLCIGVATWVTTKSKVDDLAAAERDRQAKGGVVTADAVDTLVAKHSPYTLDKSAIQAQFKSMDEKLTGVVLQTGELAKGQVSSRLKQERMDTKLDMLLERQGIKIPGPDGRTDP